MPSRADYLQQPLAQRLARLAKTPGELAEAIAGKSDAEVSRRGSDGWSARDAVCHLRDIEELVILRLHLMLVNDNPRLFAVGAPPNDAEAWGIGGDVPFPLDPDRWREERQYDRNDTAAALAAFRGRRGEVLAFLGQLSPEQWKRTSIHPEHGPVSFEDWPAGVASHDDNHLVQLRRALQP